MWSTLVSGLGNKSTIELMAYASFGDCHDSTAMGRSFAQMAKMRQALYCALINGHPFLAGTEPLADARLHAVDAGLPVPRTGRGDAEAEGARGRGEAPVGPLGGPRPRLPDEHRNPVRPAQRPPGPQAAGAVRGLPGGVQGPAALVRLDRDDDVTGGDRRCEEPPGEQAREHEVPACRSDEALVCVGHVSLGPSPCPVQRAADGATVVEADS